MPKDIIEKLKSANLLGRGGASFPTYLKWQMVKDTPAKKKYVVCNVSEGELDVFKDGFILENYPTQIVEGLKIALKTIDHSYGYIFLRKDYYQKYKKILPVNKILELCVAERQFIHELLKQLKGCNVAKE